MVELIDTAIEFSQWQGRRTIRQHRSTALEYDCVTEQLAQQKFRNRDKGRKSIVKMCYEAGRVEPKNKAEALIIRT